MKYALIRYAVFVVTIVSIITTKDLYPIIWGIVLGVAVTAHAISWQVIAQYEVKSKSH